MLLPMVDYLLLFLLFFLLLLIHFLKLSCLYLLFYLLLQIILIFEFFLAHLFYCFCFASFALVNIPFSPVNDPIVTPANIKSTIILITNAISVIPLCFFFFPSFFPPLLCFLFFIKFQT